MNVDGPRQGWEITRDEWRGLSLYGRFEQLITWVLAATIGLIVCVAAFRLVSDVVRLLLVQALNPLEHEVFQTVFGAIMTVLIALEFSHSIVHASARPKGIVQVRTVILIALLALTRKFIILDVKLVPASTILGLAVALLALGVTYWLLRNTEGRRLGQPSPPDAAKPVR
ncbi:MAG TPA: phosphate-starvation-inducible PsiE family protein [Vicinamibacteria bacterium]|nr:phosphate-starvation-inducible PsiE family protein [Vicinamibacteria bacterium]